MQLGYEQAAYAVTEETGILLLCVTVSNGSLGTSLNVTSTLTGGDATGEQVSGGLFVWGTIYLGGGCLTGGDATGEQVSGGGLFGGPFIWVGVV